MTFANTDFSFNRPMLGIEVFERSIKVQTEPVFKRYSAAGGSSGVKPRTLLNRRLAWPNDAVEKFTGA